MLEKEMLDERMFELSFSLGNEGTDETGNVNIFVQFPSGIKLYTDKSKKKVDIDKPMTPPAYSPFFDPRLKESMQLYSSPHKGNYVKMWNLAADTSKREFTYKTSAVNHHVVHSLEDLDGLYIDKETCGYFQIQYHIIDSKHIDRIDGIINVVVE